MSFFSVRPHVRIAAMTAGPCAAAVASIALQIAPEEPLSPVRGAKRRTDMDLPILASDGDWDKPDIRESVHGSQAAFPMIFLFLAIPFSHSP